MAEVKRKKGESFESLLRRFNKKLQQSGRILQAKKIRFYARPVNKNKAKKAALYRKDETSRREYLRKIGKLPEDEMRKYFNRNGNRD